MTGAGLERFLRLERAYVNEADKLAICARLRQARVEAGLTELEIAEMLTPPVTVRTIYNYEHERPPFRYLRQWAEITNTSYDWLLRGVEPEDAAASSDAGSPSGERILRQLAEQDSRLARMENQIQELLRLLGGESSPEANPGARVVYRPARP